MKTKLVTSILILMTIGIDISFAGTQKLSQSGDQKEKAAQWLSTQNEKGFLENRGQMTDMKGNPVPDVLFKTESPNLNFWITKKGITLQTKQWRKEMKKENELTEEDKQEEKRTGKRKADKFLDWERIDIELKGANIIRENILKEKSLQGHNNFFYAHCPDGIYGVKEYEKVTIREVYAGIDWVFYRKSDGTLKYDFVVHPGAEYRQIELLYKSKTPVNINEQGQLELYTGYGNVKENTPVSFYDGKEIKTQFEYKEKKEIEINGDRGCETGIAFNVAPLPSGEIANGTLIIDPQLFWASFYGGNDAEGGWSLATDACGNLFEAGYVQSTSFFPVLNAGTYFQGTNAGSWDAYILKFDNAGMSVWATYYGGTAGEFAQAIEIDPSGNAWVTGMTMSTNFPVQNGGGYYQGTNGGSNDFFILKFDNNGNRLLATYYGGSAGEVGNSIAIDATGNVFITGDTQSGNCPTQNPFQATNGGGRDAFIMKFDNACNRLWATYYGGSADEESYAIATDATGNVWVTGTTYSNNFPTLNAGTFFQAANAASNDAFILKFDNAGNRLLATYYGGNGGDKGYGLAVDATGNIFVLGVSTSTNFPTQTAGTFFQPANAGSDDAFILKFDNAGTRLWATYYGGAGSEYSGLMTYDNIAIDPCGNVYVSFETTSANMSTLASCDASGYNDNSFNGGNGGFPQDLFISLFSNTGVRLWATYFGGDGNDFRSPITLDINGNLFLAGEWSKVSNSATYPVTDPGASTYYDPTFNGNFDDGFIAKFCSHTCVCSSYQGCSISATLNVTATSVNPLCNAPCTGTATALATAGGCTGGSVTYSWSTIPVQTTQTATGLCAGVYTVTVTDQSASTATATVIITQPPAVTVSTTATAQTCTQGGTATATASGGTSPFTYLWCNGASTSAVSGLAPGSCTVLITDASGCSVIDTITIISSANSPTITASSTSSACGSNNGTASVNANGGTLPYTFSWSTSPVQTSQTATGLSSGVYSITVTDSNGCTSISTATVTSISAPIASATSATICVGQNAVINASGGTNYLWSNGATTSSINLTTAGNYSVIVSIGSCSDTAFSTVVVNPAPAAAVASSSTIVAGQTVTLVATGGGTYLWSTASIDSSILVFPFITTVYCVTVTNTYNCTDVVCATVTIEPIDCSKAGELFLPNAFSPNGDNENETFGLYYGDYSCLKSYQLIIYSRWGELVFESTNPAMKWDGSYQGKIESSAVFAYYMKATLITGLEIIQKGNVSLCR